MVKADAIAYSRPSRHAVHSAEGLFASALCDAEACVNDLVIGEAAET
jgi:hypothetical protein